MKKKQKVPPYSQLALIYDHIMRHVNYREWAEFLAGLFSKADVEVKSVLDISCGTGSLLLRLHELGFKASGFDAAYNMVAVAKGKIQTEAKEITVWQSSMQAFAFKKPFDAIVSTYDSFNYCLNEAACVSVFKHTVEALPIGGLFIFDICTEKNSRRNFQNFYERDGADEFEYIRQCYYLKDKKLQVNEFEIEWNSGSERSYREIHHQRIYRISEVKKMIPPVFELLGIYDEFSRRPGSEKSERVHFVLRRVI